MRYALLDDDGIVINLINWDGHTPIGNLDLSKLINLDSHPNNVSFGWRYIDGVFYKPEEE